MLKAIASMAGHTTMCSAFLQPKGITIKVEQIEVRHLLDQLCAKWDCTWNIADGGLFVEAKNE